MKVWSFDEIRETLYLCLHCLSLQVRINQNKCVHEITTALSWKSVSQTMFFSGYRGLGRSRTSSKDELKWGLLVKHHRWKHGCHVGSSASSSRYDNQAFARIVEDLKREFPSDYFEKSWSEECLYLILSNLLTDSQAFP